MAGCESNGFAVGGAAQFYALREKLDSMPVTFRDAYPQIGRVYKMTLHNNSQQDLTVELVDFLPSSQGKKGRLVWLDYEGKLLESGRPWVRRKAVSPQNEGAELLGYQFYPQALPTKEGD